jgi:hypothetical protein
VVSFIQQNAAASQQVSLPVECTMTYIAQLTSCKGFAVAFYRCVSTFPFEGPVSTSIGNFRPCKRLI